MSSSSSSSSSSPSSSPESSHSLPALTDQARQEEIKGHGGGSRPRHQSNLHLPQNSRIVHPSYLEGHSNKKDLIRRLHALVDVLRNDESIEPDSEEWPGLASLATDLVNRHMDHKDKDVRLYSLLACMEIFGIYAPEVPWDEDEILNVFRNVISQLGNLAHTTDPSQPHFAHYRHILDLLANVKIGVVLVDIVKQRGHHHHHRAAMVAPSGEDSDDAWEILVELIRTLLHVLRPEHPRDISELVQLAIIACLEEFSTIDKGGAAVPIRLLEELLAPIGQGPTITVTNPAVYQQTATPVSSSFKKTSRRKSAEPQGAGLDGADIAGLDKPDATKQQKSVPMLIEEINPIYLAAVGILRSQLNRLATPVAALINGVLNDDAAVKEQTTLCHKTDPHEGNASGPDPIDVYEIIYELHNVSPQILTTVIGTVSNGLHAADSDKRFATSRLLGRLFAANHGSLAIPFGKCFQEWLGRHVDVQPRIRKMVVQSCLKICFDICRLQSGVSTEQRGVLDDVIDCLTKTLVDPLLDVRLEALHGICSEGYNLAHRNSMPDPLLRAVGNRIGARHKQERKDAVTGLAQIYFRQYISSILENINNVGDDCNLGVILDVVQAKCHYFAEYLAVMPSSGKRQRRSRRQSVISTINYGNDDVDHERYSWIPSKIFEGAYFTDQTDPDMRSRVIQIMDEILLGNEGSSRSHMKLTPAARAVGLTIVVNSILTQGRHPQEKTFRNGGNGKVASMPLWWNRQSSCGRTIMGINAATNAFRFLQQLLGQRANLQKAIATYIDSRAKMRAHKAGTEAFLVASSSAREVLDVVAGLTAPPAGSQSEVLDALHAARDQHIFRILATITNPQHSSQARARALEELPRRTKPLGDAVSEWMKILVRRCAMGSFINVGVLHQCLLLATECFREQKIVPFASFLNCVKLSIDFFPCLCGNKDSLSVLISLFLDCMSVAGSSDWKVQLDSLGVSTTLGSILALATPFAGNIETDTLYKQLYSLSSRSGTPYQARNAVTTLVHLARSKERPTLESNSVDAFLPLLKTLATHLRSGGGKKGGESPKTISILASLAALAESAPTIFQKGNAGEKAINFALDTVLLESFETNHDDQSGTDNGIVAGQVDEHLHSPSPSTCDLSLSSEKRKSPSNSYSNPDLAGNLLEDPNLSVSCRIRCAAIEFLTCLLQSVCLKRHGKNEAEPCGILSEGRIKLVFDLLSRIVRFNGLPATRSREKKICTSQLDQAGLRLCAAMNLLRLCDARLGLEKRYLTVPMWHTLASAFLDDDYAVREAILEEYSMLLKGAGLYGTEASGVPAQPPSLRIVAMVVLCSDSLNSADRDGANGNAANAGKAVTLVRASATQCVANLRKLAEITSAKCRSLGKQAEQKFENQLKMLLMPEYSVPFAFHLLCHRQETPSEEIGAKAESLGQDKLVDQETLTEPKADKSSRKESGHRILQKRLKLLLEPLVHSLGETADNISFLIRMSEILGKNFEPVDASPGQYTYTANPTLQNKSFAAAHNYISPPCNTPDMLVGKLQTVASVSRDILLSLVTKDVNLATYPGAIQIPSLLFRKSAMDGKLRIEKNDIFSSPARKCTRNEATSGSNKSRSTESLSVVEHNNCSFKFADPTPKRQGDVVRTASARNGRVHFSPEAIAGAAFAKVDKTAFGALSPILKSDSPATSLQTRQSGEAPHSGDTMGTSPPSAVRHVLVPSSSTNSTNESFTDLESSALSSQSPIAVGNVPPKPIEFAMDAPKLRTASGLDPECRKGAKPDMIKRTAGVEKVKNGGVQMNARQATIASLTSSWASARTSALSKSHSALDLDGNDEENQVQPQNEEGMIQAKKSSAHRQNPPPPNFPSVRPKRIQLGKK